MDKCAREFTLRVFHTWNAPPFGERDSARFAPARARLSSASTVSTTGARVTASVRWAPDALSTHWSFAQAYFFVHGPDPH